MEQGQTVPGHVTPVFERQAPAVFGSEQLARILRLQFL